MPAYHARWGVLVTPRLTAQLARVAQKEADASFDPKLSVDHQCEERLHLDDLALELMTLAWDAGWRGNPFEPERKETAC